MFFAIIYSLLTLQRWQKLQRSSNTCRVVRISFQSVKAQATGVRQVFNKEKMKIKIADYLICKKALPLSAFRK